MDIPYVDGGYKAILADPPWSFKSWSEKGNDRAPDALVRCGGNEVRHYQTMGIESIKQMPISDVAGKDSVLFLWAIDCMLPEAISVGSSWGFTYKTVAFTWAKLTKSFEDDYGVYGKDPRDETGFWHTGLGYWTRGNPEQCLLFTRGKPKRLSASVRQFICSTRREHSRKPDEIYDRIEALVPGPYLELFSRTKREGWESWGNQAGRFSE